MIVEDNVYITPKPGIIIKQEGNFDFSKLYKESVHWFAERKYDFTEKEHTEKDKPQGKEIIANWQGEREIDEYVKFEINPIMLITEYRNKKGNIKVNIKAFLELDHKGTWSKKPFSKFLKFIYNNFIIKNRIEKYYKAKLYDELIEYSNIVKSNLGLF